MHVCVCRLENYKVIAIWLLFSAVSAFLMKVEHKRIELLQHPLVAELLNYKWKNIVLPSILLQMISYFTFLAFLTSYVLCLPNPKGDTCFKSKDTKFNQFIV